MSVRRRTCYALRLAKFIFRVKSVLRQEWEENFPIILLILKSLFLSLSKIKRFNVRFQFLKDSSLNGLNLLMKIGKRDKIVSIPTVSNMPYLIERKIAVAREKIDPMEASQIMSMTAIGIRANPRISEEKANSDPAKTPSPRPPAKFKNKDQLLPVIAKTPERTWVSGENPSFCAKKTARYPFPMSIKAVTIPCHLPTFLKTLDPEVFLHPIFKISFPKQREIRYPDGIEPKI